MKLSFLSLLVVLAVITGCKKKEEALPDVTPATPDAADTYRGFMISSTWTNSIGSSSKTGRNAEARFHIKPVKAYGRANELDLKSVMVNHTALTNKSGAAYMLAAPPSLDLTVDTWSLTGNVLIPSFAFKNKNPFPSCTDFNVIPDSVSKSKGSTFIIEDVTNVTSGLVSIGDGVGGALYFPVVLHNNFIEIKPAQLTAFTPGAVGFITLNLENTTNYTVLGKNFQFVKKAYLTKPFKVTP